MRAEAGNDEAAVRLSLKRLIVDSLRLEGLTPETIVDDAPLFGEGLGLDSVDALELVVAIEKEYGIRIESHEVSKDVFTSVAHLAEFVTLRLAGVDRDPSPDGT